MLQAVAIHVERHNLTYFPVPKTACTSIKNLMYELKFGVRFPNAHPELRRVRSIHRLKEGFLQESSPLQWQNSTNFCFVREPIARLLSAYVNRVLMYGQLSPERLVVKRKTRGLKPDPDLEEFLDNFQRYREASFGIRHHTEPFVEFVGESPEHYARIFQPKDMNQFEDWMANACGIKVTVPHLKKSNQKISPDALSPRHLAMLKDFYRRDFQFMEAAKLL